MLAQGAFAFHTSTSCREMKRMIPRPMVRPAKPMALDVVPSPQQAPDDQGDDHDCSGDARCDLQDPAVFGPAPLFEGAAQVASEPAQEAEAARCLHQGQQE
jgi:hypothetical protein